MELKELCKEFNDRYHEVYTRIGENIEQLKYAMRMKGDLDCWKICDDEFITIKTAIYSRGETDYYEACVECDYLENDEVFKKWLDNKCNERKQKDEDEKNYNIKKAKEMREAFQRGLKNKLNFK